MIGFQIPHDRLNDPERQLELIANLPPRGHSASREKLQDKALKFFTNQSGLLNRRGALGPIRPVIDLSIAEQLVDPIEQFRQPPIDPCDRSGIGPGRLKISDRVDHCRPLRRTQ